MVFGRGDSKLTLLKERCGLPGHCLWKAGCVALLLPSCCLSSSVMLQPLQQQPMPCCCDSKELCIWLHSLWRSRGMWNGWWEFFSLFQPKITTVLSFNLRPIPPLWSPLKVPMTRLAAAGGISNSHQHWKWLGGCSPDRCLDDAVGSFL